MQLNWQWCKKKKKNSDVKIIYVVELIGQFQ